MPGKRRLGWRGSGSWRREGGVSSEVGRHERVVVCLVYILEPGFMEVGAGRGNGDKCFMVHEVFQRGAIGVPGLRAEVLGLLE
jgi:hypothetical protein